MSNQIRQISQSHGTSAKVAQMLQTRTKLAQERDSERGLVTDREEGATVGRMSRCES